MKKRAVVKSIEKERSFLEIVEKCYSNNSNTNVQIKSKKTHLVNKNL